VRTSTTDPPEAVNPVSPSVFRSPYLVELLNHMNQSEIHLHSQERREQRKLKRAATPVKSQATTDVSTSFQIMRANRDVCTPSEVIRIYLAWQLLPL
jgi:hypothetical protein